MNIPANDSALIPIFIFSLPRSGSTLLQRILGASREISTVAEPWILLPYIYTLKSDGIISDYWHQASFKAIKDFYQEFPNGKQDYRDELRRFILNLYQKASNNGSIYFIDKTPRYSIICDEIIKLFPDGKFVFLWRHPLAIVSSIINSWTNGKWKVRLYKVDLFDGIHNLLRTYTLNKSNTYALKYEDLVLNPRKKMGELSQYLGIDFMEQGIETFQDVKFKGKMGDKVGTKKYNSLSIDSLNEWENTFANPFRKHWAKKYLAWIGKENLNKMGYNYSETISVLQNVSKVKIPEIFFDLLSELFLRSKYTCSIFKTLFNGKRFYF